MTKSGKKVNLLMVRRKSKPYKTNNTTCPACKGKLSLLGMKYKGMTQYVCNKCMIKYVSVPYKKLHRLLEKLGELCQKA